MSYDDEIINEKAQEWFHFLKSPEKQSPPPEDDPIALISIFKFKYIELRTRIKNDSGLQRFFEMARNREKLAEATKWINAPENADANKLTDDVDMFQRLYQETVGFFYLNANGSEPWVQQIEEMIDSITADFKGLLEIKREGTDLNLIENLFLMQYKRPLSGTDTNIKDFRTLTYTFQHLTDESSHSPAIDMTLMHSRSFFTEAPIQTGDMTLFAKAVVRRWEERFGTPDNFRKYKIRREFSGSEAGGCHNGSRQGRALS